jgi:hypothetical protein
MQVAKSATPPILFAKKIKNHTIFTCKSAPSFLKILILNPKSNKMKKIVFVIGLGALMSFGLNSCSKCGTCSDQNKVFYKGEYCQGNNLEDAFYEAAKAQCENAGGTFDK